jgi:hypothetical protein
MAFAFPLSSFAADRAAGVLRASGKVEVNGSASSDATALFTGDWVQTGSDSAANITAQGSSVLVMPNGFVRFDGQALDLSHGAVVVSTSKNLSVKADDFTIAPVAATAPTKFEVAAGAETVVIAARKGDLTLTSNERSETIPEGKQTSVRRHRGGAVAAASGAPISGKTAGIIAGTAGAIAAAVVVATTGNPCPISPSRPGDCNK